MIIDYGSIGSQYIINFQGLVGYFYYLCHGICIYDNYCLILRIQTQTLQFMINWNDKVKRLLKSELVKRGFSNADLALLLRKIDVYETKASIDSKISRGTFSASFFLQCLSVIGCSKVEIEEYESNLLIASESDVKYEKLNKGEYEN